eukprot:scaffold162_cov176-Amphora_coffeaeformis.AAC.27
MPIPPPPPMAFAAVAAAAKVAVKEYLPALSSASLAAWLLQWMWQRVPGWIKEDVVWRKRNNNKSIDSNSNHNNSDQERLSTLWERHRALLAVAESLLVSPVPHLPASILAYLQISSQLRHQPACVGRRNEIYQQAGSSGSPDEISDELKRALDWAVWAYDVHDEKGLTERLAKHKLILERRFQSDRPGSVGYFVAISDDLLVISIKGTSCLEDILTDTCGRAVPYQDYYNEDFSSDAPIEVRGRVADQVDITPLVVHDHDDSCHSSVEVISGHERVLFPGGDTTTILHNQEADDKNRHIRCHEGILLSALAVVREVQGLVQKHMPGTTTRRLRVVGHSLGASVACFVAMILRSRLPWLADTKTHALHVYAFAPPPVVDYDSALSCASYVTAIVNNSDIIPRSSLVNVALWLEILRSVSAKLVEAGLAPATSAPRLARFVKHIYGIGDKNKDGEDTTPTIELLTVEQIWTAVEGAREYFPLRHPDHLYIPGKVLLMYQDWGIVDDETDDQTLCSDVPYQCRVTDGTALALQTFEVDGFRWLGDHTTASYYRCLSQVTVQS